MPDSVDKDDAPVPEPTSLVQAHDEEPLEDEEKILAGRHDINYPALLTKDVPGG